MKTHLRKILTGLAIFAAYSLPSHADDALTPEAIHIQRCSACHLQDGQSAGAEFPNIAGQYEQYLLKALKQFKEKKRESEAMQLIASLHKEQELVILADYFAKQKPSGKAPIVNPDQSLWSRGQQIFTSDRVFGLSCADCHGDDAKGYVRMSPRTRQSRAIPSLAGQQPGYLFKILEKYTSSRGPGPQERGMCGMRRAGKSLNDHDIKALVEFLASK